MTKKHSWVGEKKVMVSCSDLSTMNLSLWDKYWEYRNKNTERGMIMAEEVIYPLIEKNRKILEKKGYY